MRFLKEDPWTRLHRLREAIPNVLFQMLLRGSNAVGYTNYPDNVVERFVEEAAGSGVDVFRVFDSLNWTKGMTVAMEAVRRSGKVCEAAMCYTGDITDPKRDKYPLAYYVSLAQRAGAHGRPYPGHEGHGGADEAHRGPQARHGAQGGGGHPDPLPHPRHLRRRPRPRVLEAAAAGVDVVDAALSSLSGLTAQPNLNALVAALAGTERDPGLDARRTAAARRLLGGGARVVRALRVGAASSGTAEVYRHEIPGGQYSNFRPQVAGLGLLDRWEECKEMYRKVNVLFGDIIKVTPTSKVVGDMAMFMVKNDLQPEDVLRPAARTWPSPSRWSAS